MVELLFQKRRQIFRISVLIVAANLLLASLVRAEEVNALIESVPRGYIGEFQWDGDKTVQNVAIKFDLVRALDDQNAEATGCGVYDVNGRITKIKIRMLIQWSDLRVEILEQSPESNVSFETDGSHRGNLSKDLQQIDAQWTTRSSGQRGQLHLRASSSAICAPASSV